MPKAVKVEKTEVKAIEVPTIRLSVDETRMLIRAQSAGKPIEGYSCNGLADLGLMVRISLGPADIQKRVDEAWKRVSIAVRAKDAALLSAAIRQLESARGENEKAKFSLTDLGRSVARGVTVRMSAQQ